MHLRRFSGILTTAFIIDTKYPVANRVHRSPGSSFRSIAEIMVLEGLLWRHISFGTPAETARLLFSFYEGDFAWT